MGAFGGLILTNKGRALQAKAQSGTQLNFTRIGVGDGSLSGQSITELNSLISDKKSLDITKLKTQSTDKAVVGGILSNQDIVTGFYFREIGVFAQDPDVGEVLYCYGNAGAGAEYIPPGGGADIVEKSIDIVTIVGNASNITATIDSSLVYATYQDLLDHEQSPAPHSGHENAANKGQPNGYAALDADGKVPVAQVPDVSWVNIKDKPTNFTPSAHKSTHATGGSDPITPADIGAETPANAQIKANNAEANAKSYAMNSIAVGSTSDPNTTQESYILTNHANSPGLGSFWHIQTYFYSSKTGNRSQIATRYNGGYDEIFIRSSYSNVWTSWKRVWHEGNTPQTRINNGQLEYLDGGVWKGVSSGVSVHRTVEALGPASNFNYTVVLNVAGAGKITRISTTQDNYDQGTMAKVTITIDGGTPFDLKPDYQTIYARGLAGDAYVYSRNRLDMITDIEFSSSLEIGWSSSGSNGANPDLFIDYGIK